MSLKDDIIKTIEYAKSYGCVLNKQQVVERLIGSTNHNLNPSPPRSRGNLPLKKGEKLAEILGKKFKNILFIGVTGSVAAEFPNKNDDIDLFIIVRNNTLWITRFWVRIFVFLNKIPHRKFGKKEQRDEFCFNMWLDETALELPKNRQKMRNAVDMVLMKKVYDKNDTYLKFIKANGWAKKFVATPYYNLNPSPPRQARGHLPLTRENNNNYLINLIYFLPQYLYLKLKGRNDLVDLHRAMWGKG